MRAVSATLPPPVGGWDTRESLADMPETHAVVLDNWFPDTDKLTVRGGNSAYSTGMTGDVETLVEYVPNTGTGKLFACNGGAIYDVTAGGEVGAPASSGHVSNRWEYVNMGTAAGQFARLVNGIDTPLLYDGTTWSTTTITGPTAESLNWINVHQRRMWVGEKDSLSAWYLAVNAVSGAATEFSLAGIARLGGYIVAMGTWTRDSGDGMDDVAVFLTSEGEAIVYSGIDPANAATWGLVGVFRIGKPIGRRCMMKGGADLILMTEDGFVPLSGILSMDRSQSRLVALSDQISRAVNDSVKLSGELFGWQPILYPRGTLALFNIPTSGTNSIQYVFNTITGAPTRYTGINARCWGLVNDRLFWGTDDGRVMLFDEGTDDDGVDILVDAAQAFSYFGTPYRNKAFKLVEPIFQSVGDPGATIEINVDFGLETPTTPAASTPSVGALWGVAKWGVDVWGSGEQIYRGWRGVRGVGRAGSVRIRMLASGTTPSWLATNFSYVPAGVL